MHTIVPCISSDVFTEHGFAAEKPMRARATRSGTDRQVFGAVAGVPCRRVPRVAGAGERIERRSAHALGGTLLTHRCVPARTSTGGYARHMEVRP